MMDGTICNSSITNICEDYDDNDISPYNPYNYQFVVFCLASLLGTIGNGLVIWFCLFRMEKTISVIWFLNLAISHFMFAQFLLFHIVNTVFQFHWSPYYWIMIIEFPFHLNMVVSVLQLAAISVDRCICVVFPVWCRTYRTRRSALIVVLITWIFSVSSHIINVIPLHLLDHNSDWILIVRFVFFFLLPFIVIVSSYTILIWRIKDKSILRSSRPFKIIITMVIAFFICWFPFYFFHILPMNLHRNLNTYITGRSITGCLMVSNCCINPILYVFIGQDFRKKCCGSFQAVLEKAFREDMGEMNFRENQQSISSGLLPVQTNTSVV